MMTLYFAGFCIFIFLIVVWGYKFDDYEEFNRDLGKKKFSLTKSVDETVTEDDEVSADVGKEDDLPRGNLL